MKTKEFSFFVGNEEKKFTVKTPSISDQKEANKIYNTAFSDAIKAKALVRAKLDDVLVEQGLWDDLKQSQFTQLQNSILEGERVLAKGGISLSEARDRAVKMRQARVELRDLIAVKTNLDTHTAEGQADNAKFNYLVSCSLVYSDTKQPYFSGYEDYLNRAADPIAILAAQHLASMLYGLDNDYEEKLPENKFLKKYKFIDEKLRLINKEGKLVDSEGRLIDANGRFINEKGDFVDKDGNLVSEQGDYLVEFSPFLDDQGKPIVEDNQSEVLVKEDSPSTVTEEAVTQTVEEKSSEPKPA
jgi:hypothetical protein